MSDDKDDDLPFKIHVIGEGEGGLGEAIARLLEAKFAGRAQVEDLKASAEKCLDNHLGSVDDDVAQDLTQRIWDICKDSRTGDVLMALAQTVANVIGERATPDEVRDTVAQSPLRGEEARKAMEQGLHEAECWNCFNRNVSVRLGAFGLLLSKLGAAMTGMQPDAPEHVKEQMKAITDKVYDRPSGAVQH